MKLKRKVSIAFDIASITIKLIIYKNLLRCLGTIFKNQLKIQLKDVTLFIDEWDAEKIYDSVTYGFDYVVSYIPIEYRNKKLGVYRMIFNLSGESFDEFFVLD